MGVRRIVVLAGSARRESLNKRLARVAAARVSALGGEGVFMDLADYRLPLYDGDYETANGVPGPALALGEQVAGADGLMIASPEWSHQTSPNVMVSSTTRQQIGDPVWRPAVG